VVYVPSYNPYTVYYPPPAYVYNPVAPLVTFTAGVAMGAIIANNCNWSTAVVITATWTSTSTRTSTTTKSK
jgi:hypothetical protein